MRIMLLYGLEVLVERRLQTGAIAGRAERRQCRRKPGSEDRGQAHQGTIVQQNRGRVISRVALQPIRTVIFNGNELNGNKL